MSWQPLDLNNIPTESGVYGFKMGDRWLYVGKARNLQQRLNPSRHIPLRIALSLQWDIEFFYQLSPRPGKLEAALLKELEPDWNGGNSGGGSYPCCSWAWASLEEQQSALSVLWFVLPPLSEK